jgi:P4 family phage/plasmid primase-like protien
MEWFTGKTTFEVVEEIGKHLGVESDSKGPSGSKSKKKNKKQTKEQEQQEESNEEDNEENSIPYWQRNIVWKEDFCEKLVLQWCCKKEPITIESLRKAKGRFGNYRIKFSVIGIPIWNQKDESIGYAIYNATGGFLEYHSVPGDPPDILKIKNLISKGQSGWMGRYLPGEGLVIKTEGPTDMLAMLTIAPDDVSVICNPHGATETPAPWLVAKMRGRKVYTVHDCDFSGQSGATYVESANRSRPGWAVAFASEALESKNVVLPYPIADSHGKDLRDWINEQLESGLTKEQTWQEFLKLADNTESIELDDKESALVEEIDSPMRLARINLDNYRKNFGGTLKYWKDEWWRYKDGLYTKIGNSEIKGKITSAIQSEFEREFTDARKSGSEKDVATVRKISSTLISNVVECTRSLCLLPGSTKQPSWLEDESQPHWLSMQNGILDLQAIFEGYDPENHLRTHSENWFSSTKLKYSYDPNAKCERWHEYLEYVMEGDHERISLLQEWCGYLLTSSNYLQRFLALMGDGGNGKSVFMAVVVAMLGQDNCGHVPLESFSGRFDLGTLVGKSCNICNDVGEIDSLAEGILKQFTGGDPMQYDRKNLSPIVCRPTAKLIMSFNKAPKIKDRTKGIWRRMLLIPFNRSIPKEKMVRHMDQAEFWIDSGEISGILNWAIAGLQRLRDQGDFTQSSVSDEAIEEYKKENNPVLDFFEEYIEVVEGTSLRIAHVFSVYQHWCNKVNGRSMSLKNFGAEVKRKYGDIKVRSSTSGDRDYCYRGLSFSVSEVFGMPTRDEKYGF